MCVHVLVWANTIPVAGYGHERCACVCVSSRLVCAQDAYYVCMAMRGVHVFVCHQDLCVYMYVWL